MWSGALLGNWFGYTSGHWKDHSGPSWSCWKPSCRQPSKNTQSISRRSDHHAKVHYQNQNSRRRWWSWEDIRQIHPFEDSVQPFNSNKHHSGIRTKSSCKRRPHSKILGWKRSFNSIKHKCFHHESKTISSPFQKTPNVSKALHAFSGFDYPPTIEPKLKDEWLSDICYWPSLQASWCFGWRRANRS